MVGNFLVVKELISAIFRKIADMVVGKEPSQVQALFQGVEANTLEHRLNHLSEDIYYGTVHKNFIFIYIYSFTDFKNVAANRKEAFKRLREFEGYWQVELCTLDPTGMNTLDEFHRNRYAQEKASFHPLDLGSGIMDSAMMID